MARARAPCQPVLDEPDTANRTLIAILDMRQKIRLAWQGQVTLESEDNIPKGRIVSAPLGAVSRKVDIDAPPAQLCAEVPEGQQLVCSNQDMNRIGEAGQGLDRVELVLEFATALHLGQVLSLVDEERFWPPMNQAAF